MGASLHFVGRLFAEQTGGLKDQDHDQQRKVMASKRR